MLLILASTLDSMDHSTLCLLIYLIPLCAHMNTPVSLSSGEGLSHILFNCLLSSLQSKSPRITQEDQGSYEWSIHQQSVLQQMKNWSDWPKSNYKGEMSREKKERRVPSRVWIRARLWLKRTASLSPAQLRVRLLVQMS
ncbi:hypothetical protein FGO68_gene8189 [Halteria grandinella]|uniref:Uncharacterized protein n=1 Tax=Halteria grandinella TaxID=5974 RepID=A0A8J8P5Q4_HALGN|nr:hypothetical protein FGO68_gene8189 [Halteria grandinella]